MYLLSVFTIVIIFPPVSSLTSRKHRHHRIVIIMSGSVSGVWKGNGCGGKLGLVVVGVCF